MIEIPKDVRIPTKLVEVEFVRQTRVGSTIYNAGVETDHGGGRRSKHPADKAGFDAELADLLVARGDAVITRPLGEVPFTEKIGANMRPNGDDQMSLVQALIDSVNTQNQLVGRLLDELSGARGKRAN